MVTEPEPQVTLVLRRSNRAVAPLAPETVTVGSAEALSLLLMMNEPPLMVKEVATPPA